MALFNNSSVLAPWLSNSMDLAGGSSVVTMRSDLSPFEPEPVSLSTTNFNSMTFFGSGSSRYFSFLTVLNMNFLKENFSLFFKVKKNGCQQFFPLDVQAGWQCKWPCLYHGAAGSGYWRVENGECFGRIPFFYFFIYSVLRIPVMSESFTALQFVFINITRIISTTIKSL